MFMNLNLALSNWIASLFQAPAADALELEHALIMLLLLAGLLSIKGEHRRYAPAVIGAGILLSLFTPTHSIEPLWPYITALLVPPLVWQVATRIATAKSEFTWLGLGLWLLTTLLVGGGLTFGTGLDIGLSLLFSMLVASLVWQARTQFMVTTNLGVIGQLVLAVLLVEVDATIGPVGAWVGALFSGAGIGAALGVIAILIANRISQDGRRNIFFLAVIYVAYVTGYIPGVSNIAIVTMTTLIVAIYGKRLGLWSSEDSLPLPLNNWPIFILAALAWLALGWQAHVPLTVRRGTGIIIGLLVVAAGVWLRRLISDRNDLPPFEEALFRKEVTALLWLAGALLLWPQSVMLDWQLLAIAFLSSVVIIIFFPAIATGFLKLISLEPD